MRAADVLESDAVREGLRRIRRAAAVAHEEPPPPEKRRPWGARSPPTPPAPGPPAAERRPRQRRPLHEPAHAWSPFHKRCLDHEPEGPPEPRRAYIAGTPHEDHGLASPLRPGASVGPGSARRARRAESVARRRGQSGRARSGSPTRSPRAYPAPAPAPPSEAPAPVPPPPPTPTYMYPPASPGYAGHKPFQELSASRAETEAARREGRAWRAEAQRLQAHGDDRVAQLEAALEQMTAERDELAAALRETEDALDLVAAERDELSAARAARDAQLRSKAVRALTLRHLRRPFSTWRANAALAAAAEHDPAREREWHARASSALLEVAAVECRRSAFLRWRLALRDRRHAEEVAHRTIEVRQRQRRLREAFGGWRTGAARLRHDERVVERWLEATAHNKLRWAMLRWRLEVATPRAVQRVVARLQVKPPTQPPGVLTEQQHRSLAHAFMRLRLCTSGAQLGEAAQVVTTRAARLASRSRQRDRARRCLFQWHRFAATSRRSRDVLRALWHVSVAVRVAHPGRALLRAHARELTLGLDGELRAAVGTLARCLRRWGDFVQWRRRARELLLARMTGMSGDLQRQALLRWRVFVRLAGRRAGALRVLAAPRSAAWRHSTARRSFDAWLAHAAYMRGVRRVCRRVLSRGVNRSLAAGFLRWKECVQRPLTERLEALAHAYQTSMARYAALRARTVRQRLLGSTLSRWRSRARSLRILRTTVARLGAARSGRCAHAVFRAWSDVVRRRARAQLAHGQLALGRARTAQSRAWTRWRGALRRRALLRRTLAAFVASRAQHMARGALQRWWRQAAAARRAEQEGAAEEAQLRGSMVAAEHVWALRRSQRAARAVRGWHAWAQARRELRSRAAWFARFDDRRLQIHVLREWREAARRRASARRVMARALRGTDDVAKAHALSQWRLAVERGMREQLAELPRRSAAVAAAVREAALSREQVLEVRLLERCLHTWRALAARRRRDERLVARLERGALRVLQHRAWAAWTVLVARRRRARARSEHMRHAADAAAQRRALRAWREAAARRRVLRRGAAAVALRGSRGRLAAVLHAWRAVAREGARAAAQSQRKRAALARLSAALRPDCSIEAAFFKWRVRAGADTGAVDQLRTMAEAFAAPGDVPALFEAVAAFAGETLNCLGTLFLLDRQGQQVWTLLADTRAELRVALGMGIAGSVAASGEAAHIVDAAADPRFRADVDGALGARYVTVLCVPVLSRGGGQLVGVVELVRAAAVPFTSSQQAVARVLAAQVAATVTHVQRAISWRRQLEDISLCASEISEMRADLHVAREAVCGL